jgi:hypothetical protein
VIFFKDDDRTGTILKQIFFRKVPPCRKWILDQGKPIF